MTTRRQLMVTAATAPLWWRLGITAERAGPRLFDAHAHLITGDRTRYPRPAPAAGAAPGGAPGAGTGMSAAPGAAAGPNSAGIRETPEVDSVIRWMDASGVAGAAAVQHRGTYGYDNSYILDSVDRHPDRFVPVVVLDAQDAKTPAQVREYVKTHGLAGVRLTGMRAADGTFPWIDSEAAQATWAAANELGLVVDLMSTPPGTQPEVIADYSKLAQKYPNVRLVLDHVAWPAAEGAPDYGIDAGHRELARHRNVYYKFTTINLDMLRDARVSEPDMLRHVVDVYGADHVLWGSDIGNSAGAYGEMVQRIVAATGKLNDAERRQVLHDTGKGVFARGGRLATRRAA